jgi:hypothetical protein
MCNRGWGEGLLLMSDKICHRTRAQEPRVAGGSAIVGGMGDAVHVPWWDRDDAGDRIRNAAAALREAANIISIRRGNAVTVDEVESGLVETLALEQITDILDWDMEAEAIAALLRNYDFMRLRPERLCKVEFADSIIPASVTILLTEAKVKLQGEIWQVHKNDADPFPSNPHAHNYRNRVKLHLGNGDLYGYKEKVPSARLRKSLLLDFRARVIQANSTIVLPPLSV